MTRLASTFLGIAAVALGPSAALGQPGADAPEFWDPPVVTPSGQASRVSESPSTTFVITADDIRRGGATSLPEILRRVPGLDVRSMTSMDGQLGLRGFAYEVADRILVLVDGRTVYIDFFGGTAFDMLPVSLVDIERIEVVLGPGASIYGNKAMLGTINIITRSAGDYPFTETRVDAGPPGDGRVGVRTAAIRGDWRVRATGLARRVTPFESTGGRDPGPAGGGTLSATWTPAAGDEASLEVGATNGQTYIIPTASRIDRFDGTLAYARARARLGLGGAGAPLGDLNVDVVWNGGDLRSPSFPTAAEPFRATYHTPYARVHHELRTHVLAAPLQTRWGGEVRLNTLASNITSGERDIWNVAGFASTELLLGRWRLNGGVRVDRSTVTDASVSPRLSVVWSPVERHQIRAAYNTGYNNAHLLQYFVDFDLVPGMRLRGNPDLAAEHASYGELGWAGWLSGWLRGFATAFAYRFTDWISLQPADPAAGVITYGNNAPITAYGGELGVEVAVRRSVSGYASYAFVGPKGMGDYPYRLDPHGSPQHKVGAGVRLEHRSGAYLTVDAQYFARSAVARVSPLSTPANPFEKFSLAPYVMSYARIGYAFASGVDLSLAAANVLDDRTRQFPGAEAPERRVAATAAYYR